MVVENVSVAKFNVGGFSGKVRDKEAKEGKEGPMDKVGGFNPQML